MQGFAVVPMLCKFGTGEPVVPVRIWEHGDVGAQRNPAPVLSLELCLSVFSSALRSERGRLKDSQGGSASLGR